MWSARSGLADMAFFLINKPMIPGLHPRTEISKRVMFGNMGDLGLFIKKKAISARPDLADHTRV